MISENLKKLNIELPSAPDPVGAYVAYKIIGKIICSQGGHKLSNQLLRKVFQNDENFSLLEITEKHLPNTFINKSHLQSIA